ncbi:hypothetical protein SYK_28130 [Pseudodesulfovibrio nedwellii]|uniref:Type II secretion system protein GspC N-terminal domain-containing protein n=1 Tax=Pseudodesulfovibrio nedwellii TaxID=2973072 RepID=A0ABM8B3Q9_9BACT|nr:type II secretion system protein N [Pseudodesulfovibrio nedwellii]BDQ38453.1 hypothetical protein SYK_28130 [Pseudodesulfovibrio nedwellii]
MRELEIGRLIGRWPRLALNLSTISVVAYFLASAAVVLVVEPKLPSIHGTSIKSVQSASKVSIPPLKYFAPIWSRNAFKAARPKPPVAKKKTLAQLPVAKLNIKLVGTIYSDVTVLSRAVTLQGNKQKLVKIGDKLSGFKIVEIQRRAIVLQKGNQKQLLLIDNTDKKIAAKKGVARKMLPRRDLKAKLQDLDSLSRDIQFAPATRGKQKGLWVRQLRAGSLFSKAGLQKDDVVLSVGGSLVAHGVNPLTLFKLLDQPQVNVGILRDGKPIQLVLILTGK